MNEEFLDALRQIEKEKEIPFEVLMDTIEQALVHAYKKHYGAMDVRVRVDHTPKGFKVFTQKDVVQEVENPDIEISLAEARATNPDALVGDTVEFEVTPENFGRIAAQTAKQVVVQRIRDAEREQVYDEFGDRIGQVVTGVVQRTEQRNVVIGLGKVEALLPPPEQVPTEPYNFNDRLKVYVLEVRRTNRGPQVYVSRTHPNLIRGLFELEVPEIAEGIVEIQSVAREPGQRSKIAVSSSDERVDPVGACVGHRGTRVQSVVTELYDEKVDIVRWSPDTARFIAESLSPAKPSNVTIDEANKTALVVMPDNQLSLAIGKSGQNVRLAARLTGWRIDIRSESQADEPGAPADRDAALDSSATASEETAPLSDAPSVAETTQIEADSSTEAGVAVSDGVEAAENEAQE
ncbi:MAG: transcription termination/antitermination protein NusA [Armatimonadetes bacterium]|nr:transcription termination/antitermination protein NusA [Armatimonadota bacterium]